MALLFSTMKSYKKISLVFLSLLLNLWVQSVRAFVPRYGAPVPLVRCKSTHLEVVGPSDLLSFLSSEMDLGLVNIGGSEIEAKYLAEGAAAALALTILSTQLVVPKSLVDPSKLSQIAEGTFLANKELTCVYKGSRDGWSAIDFHEKVDGRGSAVVVCRTRTGKVFGGFNPTGWRSTDDYYDSTTAFLWCLSSAGGRGSSSIIKFPVLSGGNAAIFDYATAGPCFGSSDIVIGQAQAPIMGGFAGPDMENTAANAGDLRQGKVTPGIAYKIDERWPAFGSVSLLEVEVYCNAGVGQQKISW